VTTPGSAEDIPDAREASGGQSGGERLTYRQVRYERLRGSTEILLVRHGESAEWDPEHPFEVVDGRGDPALSPTGRAQAEAVGQRLAGLEIGALYVTQLCRTAETAAPLARRLGIVPVVVPDLVEVYMGEWEGGLYRRHIADGHPLAAEVFRRERWDVIPGAESNEELFERTGAAIRTIAAAHPDETVVVFSHAVAISSVLATATGSRPFAFVAVDNCSISGLVVSGERWTLRSFNDTAHLEGVLY